MHLALSATGVVSGVNLFKVEVGEHGRWTYESRAVEFAEGQLTEGDQAQLKHFYERVNFDLETLNSPVSADDRTLFKLEVTDKKRGHVLYQFSEALNHRSWEFRDLVHFLRHNVAQNGDPVGRIPGETHTTPPAAHP